MTKNGFVEALQRAIKEDGRGPAALALAAGLDESNIRTIMKGHAPGVERSDAILRALKQKLTIGHTEGRKRLEMKA